jgi:hypothetical protein
VRSNVTLSSCCQKRTLPGAAVPIVRWTGYIGFTIAALLAHVPRAQACGCVTDGPPCALRSGDVNFVGTAASVVEEPQSGGYGTRRYLFTVTEAFAGVSGALQEVVSTMSSCGVEFSQGRSYLVAARLASDGTVHVHAF